MPTIYDKNGKDIVSVRGIIIDNNLDEIVVDINVESGGYLFDSSMKNS